MGNVKLEYTTLKIKDWALEDRPREKLILKGRTSLSNAELIGILIGSGNASESAVDLAKKILHHTDNNINILAGLTVKDLMKFKGIGEAKAINIVSALELGRRRKQSETVEKPLISSSEAAYDVVRPFLLDLKHEEFWTIMLNRRNQVIKKQQVSSGGVSGTLVDPKIIFKNALDAVASSIILVHNHPSGNTKPSSADIRLTKKIKQAGELLEIPVLDHIIFTDHAYFSFADQNMI
ncbi:MAG: DNA repair protein RadC [Bacteroidota bacterium]